MAFAILGVATVVAGPSLESAESDSSSGLLATPTAVLTDFVAASGIIQDIEVDTIRNVAYLSYNFVDVVDVLDLTTYEIVESLPYEYAGQIALSADGDLLYITLGMEGAFAVYDVDAGTTTTVSIPQSGYDETSEIVEVSGGVVLVVAGQTVGSASRMFRYDLNTNVSDMVASAMPFSNNSRIIADGPFAYVTGNGYQLHKLDGLANYEVVLTTTTGTSGEKDRLALSPDGELIITGSGQSYDTDTFAEASSFTAGSAAFSEDGSQVLVLANEQIAFHDAPSATLSATYDTPCGKYGETSWLTRIPGTQDYLSGEGSTSSLCILHADEFVSPGRVSGTVTHALNLEPVPDVCVQVIFLNGTFSSEARTDTNGAYIAEDVPVGTYQINFYHCNAEPYLGQWYDGGSTVGDATPVIVSDNTTTSGIDATLMPVLPPGGRFFDDDDLGHEGNIEAIAARQVTLGCDPGQIAFCPNEPVTRAQMASFLVRALNLPGSTTNYFTDDNGSAHETNINAVAQAGITLGCSTTSYCPNEPVTRAQMASFLVRALNLPASNTDYFTDDNGSAHETNINAVAEAGITLGCSTTSYCPKEPVTRAQIASLLARALGYAVPDVPTRDGLLWGTQLELVSRAEDAGCDVTIRPGTYSCDLRIWANQYFFFDTGFSYPGWSELSPEKQESVLADQVTMSATLDDIPLGLSEWPALLVDDVGVRAWSYLFPNWLSGEHDLIVEFLDRTENPDFRFTITVTLFTNGAGYPASVSGPHPRTVNSYLR